MHYREMVDEESKPEEQIVLFENPKAREKKYWEFIKTIAPSHSRRPLSEVGQSRIVLVCVE